MNLIACIFKRTSAIFTLLILLIGYVPISQACVFPPPGSWKYSEIYDRLKPKYKNRQGTSERLRLSPIENDIYNAHLIFTGRAKLSPLEALPTDPERDYNTIRFKVTETLRGIKKSEYVYAVREGVVAILNPNKASDEIKRNVKLFREKEQAKIEYHNDDLFWDFSRFLELRANDTISRGSTCGPYSIPMITKNQNYLVIVTPRKTIIEPIASKDDPLLSAIKERLKFPYRQMGPELSAFEFMQKMDHLAILKAKTCNEGLADNVVMTDLLQGKFNISSDEGDFNTPSHAQLINKYYKETHIKHLCQPEQTYLVYGYKTIPSGIVNPYREFIFRYRFARIKDGNVVLDDIATHLNLSDKTLSIDMLEKLSK